MPQRAGFGLILLLCWKPTLTVLISHPQGNLGVQLCPSVPWWDRPSLPVLWGQGPVYQKVQTPEELSDSARSLKTLSGLVRPDGVQNLPLPHPTRCSGFPAAACLGGTRTATCDTATCPCPSALVQGLHCARVPGCSRGPHLCTALEAPMPLGAG